MSATETEGQPVEARRKQLKLISVAFKEASLDSPSFRATVNFFHTRIEIFEDKLQKTANFFDLKYMSTLADFRRTSESMVSQLFPSPILLSNGMVENQSQAPSLVAHFSKDYKTFTEKVLKLLVNEDDSYTTVLSDLMSNGIEPYKAARQNFEYYQNKYLNMQIQYQSMKVSNTVIEPSMAMEDAFQLFEVRQGYLQASLDLIEAITILKMRLDKYLVESMGLVRSFNIFTFKESGSAVDLCPSVNDLLEEYSFWLDGTLECSKELEQDMKYAKKQVMDYALQTLKPSADPAAYDVRNFTSTSLLSVKNLSTPSTPPEKSGWLFMKTFVGKPKREIWVQRWCFLRNGVFGMFLLSPSKTYVEETDKFGVQLVSMRPNLEEDRRFCFELKLFSSRVTTTGSSGGNGGGGATGQYISVVLQAESLKELKSWFNAIELTKKYVASLDKNSLEYDTSFKRFSPRFFEFASSTTTSVDQSLVTFDSHSKSLLNELNCTFSEYENISFGREKLYEYSMDKTPLTTKMTQLAILANSFQRGPYIPTAIQANIWGSANWADRSLTRDWMLTPSTDRKDSTSVDRPDYAVKYPAFYARESRLADLQFRNIFFAINGYNVNGKHNLVLFKFDAFCCPSVERKFPSVCYVTRDCIYSYINAAGFICLIAFKFTDLVSIEARSYDPRKVTLYDTEGSRIEFIVLFADPTATVAKLQVLLEYKAEKVSTGLEDLVNRLNKIDREYMESSRIKNIVGEQELAAQLKEVNHPNATTRGGQVGQVGKPFGKLIDFPSFWEMTEAAEKLLNRRNQLLRDSTVLYHHEYNIASKGLLHILFGDESHVFPRCLFLSYSTSQYGTNSYWKQKLDAGGNKILERTIQFRPYSPRINSGKPAVKGDKGYKHFLVIKQRVLKILENRYYEVEQEPFYTKIPFCRPLRIKVRYLITELYDPEEHTAIMLQISKSASRFTILYEIDHIDPTTGEVVTNLSYLERKHREWVISASRTEFLLFRKFITYYLERIGKHGKVIKAIKLCGLLGVTGDSQQPLEGLVEDANDKASGDVTNETHTPKQFHLEETSLIKPSLTTAVKWVFRTSTRRTMTVFLRIARWFYQIFTRFFGWLSNINKLLLLMLSLSIMVNIFLNGKTSVSYWTVRRAEKTFMNYANSLEMEGIASDSCPTEPSEQAIYVADLDLLEKELVKENENSPFFKFFQGNNFAFDEQYRETRHGLAVRRNQLLVELKLLQSMERQLVHGDYREFLLEELNLCSAAQANYRDVYTNSTQLQNYCLDCSAELEKLDSLLL